MSQEKPTTDVRQAWLLGAVAVALIFLFAFVVLPYVDPGKRPAGEAPDFDLPVLHGGEPGNRMQLSKLRGMVVLLDFWASWCGPCRKQMPILDRVARDYDKKRVMVIGVNTDTEQELARDYLRLRPVSYPSLYDEEGVASRRFGVSKLPTLVLIDADGTVQYNDARLMSERSVRDLLDGALGFQR